MQTANLIRAENVLTLDIDIDELNMSKSAKVLYVEALLFNLLHDLHKLYIRESSSGRGIHVVVEVQEIEEIRIQYDDRKRYEIDAKRKELNIESGRFLWFQKGKRKAGQWVLLENSQDIERFIREYFIYQF